MDSFIKHCSVCSYTLQKIDGLLVRWIVIASVLGWVRYKSLLTWITTIPILESTHPQKYITNRLFIIYLALRLIIWTTDDYSLRYDHDKADWRLCQDEHRPVLYSNHKIEITCNVSHIRQFGFSPKRGHLYVQEVEIYAKGNIL